MSPDDDPLRAAREMFGGNLRAVREHRGMGQRELAARMAERHFPWHQNTVTRVEKGDRDISFAEVRGARGHPRRHHGPLHVRAGPEASAVMLVGGDERAAARRRGARSPTRLRGLHAARYAAERSVAEYEDSEYEPGPRQRRPRAGRGPGRRHPGRRALDEWTRSWQRTREEGGPDGVRVRRSPVPETANYWRGRYKGPEGSYLTVRDEGGTVVPFALEGRGR